MARWLITGASGGIGGAIAAVAAAAGNDVALLARRDLSQTAERLSARGVRAVALPVDLASEDGPAEAAAGAREALGGVDVLVNNAALHRGGRVDRLSDEDYRAVLEVGLVAPFRLVREVVGEMDRGGAVVNIGAVVGLRGFPGDSPYGSAKGGLSGLTRVLAIELARHGITANLVVPGFTETEMTGELDEAARERVLKSIPLRRAAEPEEVARVVRWVAETPYMTGAIVPVDGGLMAGFGNP